MPNPSGLLTTKLQPTRVGANLIERPRLLETLASNLDRRLTLVCAPAGYGKSVALVQLVQDASAPSVWYHLDEFDNDLAVFLEYLVAGVQKHNPSFGADVLEIIGKSRSLSSEERRLVTCLVNDMESFRESGLLIILDDYHKVVDRSIHDFIEHLVEYLPRGVHFIISSRTRPPMRLSRLKVQGAMVEVGERDLSFSEDETGNLLSALSGASGDSEAVRQIHQEAQGWPAAVQLMAMSLRNTERGTSPTALLRTRRDVYEYFATEVFDSLDDRDREFLVKTSVLKLVTPDIADRLLDGRFNSAEILRNLLERGLFVSILDGEAEAYRYHDLFREFLRTKLGSCSAPLLRKAGQSLLESGNVERAVEFFLEAKEFDLAVQAMVPAGQKSMRYGRWRTVDRWLKALPPKQRKANPWMTLYEGALLVFAGKMEEAEASLEASQKAFEKTGDESGIAQCMIQLATIFRLRGQYTTSLGLIEKALAKLDPTTLDLDASSEQASSMYLQGRFEDSVRMLKTRLTLAEQIDDSYVAGELLEMLSTVYYMTGEYSKSVEAHERAKELMPDSPIENNVGAIYAEWGDLDQAVEHAEMCLRMREGMGVAQKRPYGYYQYGIVLMHKGDLDEAISNFREAIEISREQSGDRFSEALNLSFLSRCLTLQGNYRQATIVAEEAMRAGKDRSPYITAICQSAMGIALIESGDTERGLPLLEESADAFAKFGARLALMKVQANLAAVRLKQGRRQEAVSLAASALGLAVAEHYIQEFITCFSQHRPVLSLALEEGIEVEFVLGVLKRLGSKCLSMLTDLSKHEDPEVRLRCVTALAAAQPTESKEPLLRLLNDSDQRVGDRALAALRSAGIHVAAGGAVRGSLGGLLAVTPESAAVTNGDAGSSGSISATPGADSIEPSNTGISGDVPEASTDASASNGSRIAQRSSAAAVSGHREGALFVTCLGPFRVFAGDDEVEMSWRTTKSRDIFAYLLDHKGGPVSKERILEDLWPDVDESQASTLFHTSLYQLRKALRDVTGWEETVLYAGGHYRLARSLATTDVDRLNVLASQALKPEAFREGGERKPEDIELLNSILALSQGSYLEDLDYPWIAPERGRLDTLFAEAAERLARRLMELGEMGRAAGALRSLIQRNPLLEEVHCLLMTCYASMGDRMAVMQQYETLKDILDRELGVDPSAKTRSLYYQLCGDRQDDSES